MNEYSSNDQDANDDTNSDDDGNSNDMLATSIADKDGTINDIHNISNSKVNKLPRTGQGLMAVEERATGAVSGSVYVAYIKAGGRWFTGILLFISLLIIQLTRTG